MSKLGLLFLIATLALSGGVTATKPADESKPTPAAEAPRKRAQVVPLNTRGYNLPGPNDIPPASMAPDAESEAAPAAPKPR